MSYRFLEETAIADVAFEADGGTLPELFESAAQALAATMVTDIDQIKRRITKPITLTSKTIEMLLFSFLQELIFYKDAEVLLFNGFHFDIIEQKEESWYLRAEAYGEEINPEIHELLADVKGVSLHDFVVEKAANAWRASVILDV